MSELERLQDEAAGYVGLDDETPFSAEDAVREVVRSAHSLGYQLGISRQVARHDLAEFARAVQWAQRVTDAALPLSPPLAERPASGSWSADREAMRLAAFRVALDEVRKHGANGSADDLKLLWDGTVPPQAD